MTAKTLTERLAFLLDKGASPEKAAARVLRALTDSELRALARPLVEWQAKKIYRDTTRKIEVTADLTEPTSRQTLVARQFPLPDGRWVTWGQATADDHRLRAGWQRNHADACVADAVRHEDAAALLDTRKVRCLDDLAGVAA